MAIQVLCKMQRHPKVGERVIPKGSDRYFFITRVTDKLIVYRDSGETDSPYKKGKEVSLSVDLLTLAEGPPPECWVEMERPLQPISTDKKWHAAINLDGELISLETTAPTKERAKGNFTARISKMRGVSFSSIALKLSRPNSIEIKEVHK